MATTGQIRTACSIVLDRGNYQVTEEDRQEVVDIIMDLASAVPCTWRDKTAPFYCKNGGQIRIAQSVREQERSTGRF